MPGAYLLPVFSCTLSTSAGVPQHLAKLLHSAGFCMLFLQGWLACSGSPSWSGPMPVPHAGGTLSEESSPW